MAERTDTRMFDLFWVQVKDGTWVLDSANIPNGAPLTVLVRDGQVVFEWRADDEQLSRDPDEARWMATRLMEAAVLADCGQVGLLVEYEEQMEAEPPPESPQGGLFDPKIGWRPG